MPNRYKIKNKNILENQATRQRDSSKSGGENRDEHSDRRRTGDAERSSKRTQLGVRPVTQFPAAATQTDRPSRPQLSPAHPLHSSSARRHSRAVRSDPHREDEIGARPPARLARSHDAIASVNFSLRLRDARPPPRAAPGGGRRGARGHGDAGPDEGGVRAARPRGPAARGGLDSAGGSAGGDRGSRRRGRGGKRRGARRRGVDARAGRGHRRGDRLGGVPVHQGRLPLASHRAVAR